jgi:hypothetical protein
VLGIFIETSGATRETIEIPIVNIKHITYEYLLIDVFSFVNAKTPKLTLKKKQIVNGRRIGFSIASCENSPAYLKISNKQVIAIKILSKTLFVV